MTKRNEGAHPTFEQMKPFLIKRYKAERLYGRNAGNGWPNDYGDTVIKSHLADLLKYGIDCISRHESITGYAVWIRAVRGSSLREVDCKTAHCVLTRRKG